MVQSLLHKYFRGEASTEEEKLILDWVDESEENLHSFQNERLLYDISLFSNTEKSRKNVILLQLRPKLKWAVGIVAMFILFFTCGYLFNEPRNQYSEIQTVTVPAGQRAHIALADGTSIWLNSKSTLKYASNFGKKDRNIELDGEAYFEVAKDEKIPFYIHTEYNKIRVVGTAFNVCAYKGSNEFETSLIEGIVDIYKAQSEDILTRLEKEQYLSIANGYSKKGIMQSKDFLRWKEGLYCFDDTPFTELLKKLELYYDVKIVITNSKLLNYKCTGKFKQQDGVEHVLKVIQKDHYFKYSINEERDIITLK